MVDNFSIFISHALLAFALWQLLRRPDLDREPRVGEAATVPDMAPPVDPTPASPASRIRSPWGRRDA